MLSSFMILRTIITDFLLLLGQVGIALSGDWSQPATDEPADIEARERSNDFNVSQKKIRDK